MHPALCQLELILYVCPIWFTSCPVATHPQHPNEDCNFSFVLGAHVHDLFCLGLFPCAEPKGDLCAGWVFTCFSVALDHVLSVSLQKSSSQLCLPTDASSTTESFLTYDLQIVHLLAFGILLLLCFSRRWACPRSSRPQSCSPGS